MLALLLLLPQYPPQAPPVEVDSKRTYADAYYAAQKAGKPLVIFIGCKAPSYHHAPFYEWVEVGAGQWESLSGKQEYGIIIAVSNNVFKRLPPDATVNEISREVSRAMAPLQPRRVRSSTQIQWSGGVTAAQC